MARAGSFLPAGKMSRKKTFPALRGTHGRIHRVPRASPGGLRCGKTSRDARLVFLFPICERGRPHRVYHLGSGGVPLKVQGLVSISFDPGGESAAEIVLRSFGIFLEKELQDAGRPPRPAIDGHDGRRTREA